MAEITHGRQYVAFLCQQILLEKLTENSWRFEETSIRTNYAVWEVCYTVGWPSRCFLHASCLGICWIVSPLKDTGNFSFVSHSRDEVSKETQQSIISLIEKMFYEQTVQVYTYVILSVTFTLESFYVLFRLKQSLLNHTWNSFTASFMDRQTQQRWRQECTKSSGWHWL